MPPPSPAPSTTEVVHRPEPGLARGVWETKASVLYVAGALVVLAALLYLAARLQLLPRRPSKARSPRE